MFESWELLLLLLFLLQGPYFNRNATLAGAGPLNLCNESMYLHSEEQRKLEGSGAQYNILPMLQRETGKAKDILRKLYKLIKTSWVRGYFDSQFNFF